MEKRGKKGKLYGTKYMLHINGIPGVQAQTPKSNLFRHHIKSNLF